MNEKFFSICQNIYLTEVEGLICDRLVKDEEILEELKRIRTILEPKPAPIPTKPKGLWEEFVDFISKYKVMGLAVAFILGLYLGALVQALVGDLIMPIIELAMPGVAWDTIQLGPFRIGHFTGALITFLIVAFVIFIIVKITKRWGIE
ncbi:MAG: large conductance mechanosensitive channel protein MscL [Nitrososphaerales archaeon]